MPDFDLTAFYGQFRDETWENLDVLEQGLTELEAQPEDLALVDRMLRAVHTTKGSAKIMGFSQINQLAHQIEDVLGALRRGQIAMRPEINTTLLQASAAVRTLTEARVEGRTDTLEIAELVLSLQQLLGEAPEPPPGTPSEEHPEAAAGPLITVSTSARRQTGETMRVDLARVDHLTRLVGETLTLQRRARKEHLLLREIGVTREEVGRALYSLKDRLEAYENRFRPIQRDEVFHRLQWLETAVAQLDERLRDHAREQDTLLDRFNLVLEELHQEALSIRMLPIGTLFEVFVGVVRRLAADCGVEVALELRGGEVELDRRVLDLLRDPLVHLVRNALSHGIEQPEERERQGKPRRGRLLLEAHHQSGRVQVTVSDDGRGIDMERVRRRAVELGLLTEEHPAEADEAALLGLLFHPGFSTRRKATDMSGRGVGLDVVQTAMRQLSGIANIRTRAGQGTDFIMDVPLTLATIRVLMVEVAGETVAIPAAAVRNMIRIDPQDIVTVEGRLAFHWQERLLPLVPLNQLFGAPVKRINNKMPAIVSGTNGHQIALQVEHILDEAEVVVQSLGHILEQSPFFSAITLSGAGEVIPILDLTRMLTTQVPSRRQTELVEELPVRPSHRPNVLLVEDAITVRELERSILEAAGYRVETAYDGIDALQKLEELDFQLVITDIEMPRMDGFELTAHLRSEPRWSDLPIVIITSREDEDSRRRGLQVGAQAFIVKSRFDQHNMLETIAQLVE